MYNGRSWQNVNLLWYLNVKAAGTCVGCLVHCNVRFMVASFLVFCQAMVACISATMGSAILVHLTPYTPETLPLKLGAFTLFTSVMGATLAPVALMAGKVVLFKCSNALCKNYF